MKKLYELVCVIDAAVSSKGVEELKKSIEKHIEIVDTDDMWLLPLAYPLRWQEQAYFVSYHITIDEVVKKKVSNMLKLEKGVAKFVFFSMKENETFLKYADLKKSYEAIIDQEEADKMKKNPTKEEEEEETEE